MARERGPERPRKAKMGRGGAIAARRQKTMCRGSIAHASVHPPHPLFRLPLPLLRLVYSSPGRQPARRGPFLVCCSLGAMTNPTSCSAACAPGADVCDNECQQHRSSSKSRPLRASLPRHSSHAAQYGRLPDAAKRRRCRFIRVPADEAGQGPPATLTHFDTWTQASVMAPPPPEVNHASTNSLPGLVASGFELS